MTTTPRTAEQLGSPILTPEEAVVFLRLDAAGVTNPLRALAYYRNHKGLRATRFGRTVCYHRDELERFARESLRAGPEIGEREIDDETANEAD